MTPEVYFWKYHSQNDSNGPGKITLILIVWFNNLWQARSQSDISNILITLADQMQVAFMNVMIQICLNVWHLSPKPEADTVSFFQYLSCCSDSSHKDFRHTCSLKWYPIIQMVAQTFFFSSLLISSFSVMLIYLNSHVFLIFEVAFPSTVPTCQTLFLFLLIHWSKDSPGCHKWLVFKDCWVFTFKSVHLTSSTTSWQFSLWLRRTQFFGINNIAICSSVPR